MPKKTAENFKDENKIEKFKKKCVSWIILSKISNKNRNKKKNTKLNKEIPNKHRQIYLKTS